MMFTTLLELVFCFTTIVSGSSNFLNCPGNRGIFGILRRCCDSNELPNNCECFDISSNSDFRNSVFQLPQCPKDLDVSFFLYTRSNTKGTRIRAYDIPSLFDASKATKFIIHGFRDKAPNVWNVKMMNAILEQEDVNVILVNWERGAAGPNYYLCAANTRTVGAMVARLIQELVETEDDFQKFHLIGHSLGAHISGSAGKEIQRLTSHNLGRISGLDPAGPSFERYSASVGLDKSDAIFVDVIHTNADNLINTGFGIRPAIGHVDFYPNDGQRQPGCTDNIFTSRDIDDIVDNIGCSHFRVLPLYTDSIIRCDPKPYGCPMGYHAKPSCQGTVKPVTTAEPPFCVL